MDAVGSPTVLPVIPHPCAVSKPPNSLTPQGELSKLLLWFSLERRVGGACAFLAEEISQHVATVKWSHSEHGTYQLHASLHKTNSKLGKDPEAGLVPHMVVLFYCVFR